MQAIKLASLNSIAVLITSHNRKVKTMNCLQALFNQSGLGYEFNIEVFLVDDGSTDGTSEVIRSQFPIVNIIQGTGDLYWNRGMHLAWETALVFKDFDYFLWLNDDTFLYKDALLKMLNAAHKTNNISVICGSTFSLNFNNISYGGQSQDSRLLIPNGNLQEVFLFNGNVVLIPSYVYSKVGILDKSFPHAIGDYDYALRIRKANLRSYISENYVGTCERNGKLPEWCSISVPLKKRLSFLYSPLCHNHPYHFFIFELRYYGIKVGIKHFISIHLRLLFPKFWNIK